MPNLIELADDLEAVLQDSMGPDWTCATGAAAIAEWLVEHPAAMRALEPRASSDGDVERIADRIEAQAKCLEGYAASNGFEAKPVPSVFHSQAMHFRDLAAEMRALQSQPPSNEARLREALAEARHTLVRCEHVVDTESEFGNEINERIGHIDAALSNEGNG